MSSLKDQILGQKARTTTINVPGWPVPVRLQEMTVARKLAFYQIMSDNLKAVNDYKADPEKHPKAELLDEALLGVIFSIVDENDELVFSPDDMDHFQNVAYDAIREIYMTILDRNSWANEAEEIEAEKKD